MLISGMSNLDVSELRKFMFFHFGKLAILLDMVRL